MARRDGGRCTALLIVFSLFSRSYIMDLRPGNSFVERLLAAGFDVYLLDWGGWPGTHGPWRVCRAISGHALGDGLEAVEPGEVAEDSVEVCGWRREGLAGCSGEPHAVEELCVRD